MSISTKFRWKRAVNDLRYLHQEHDLIKEISRSTAAEFQKYYEDFCDRHDIDIGELNAKNADKVKEAYGIEDESDLIQISEDDALKEDLIDACEAMIEQFKGDQEKNTDKDVEDIDKAVHETFSKLFKSIASHIHPDKAQDEKDRIKFEQKFKQAKEALDSYRYFKLLEMAEELDIELPSNYNEQIKWMTQEGRKIRGMVQKEMTTYNYLFAECDSDANRDNIIKSFLKQLFDFDVPQ